MIQVIGEGLAKLRSARVHLMMRPLNARTWDEAVAYIDADCDAFRRLRLLEWELVNDAKGLERRANSASASNNRAS